METITSRDNAKIKYACRLREEERLRNETNSFFAEGPKVCLELAHACTIQALYITEAALARNEAFARFAGVTTLVMPHVAEKLAATRTNQGVFAVFAAPQYKLEEVLATARRVLALENVQDPGNVGTLLRSAAAFGFDAVLLSRDCAAPFAPKTLRASVGAAGRLPVLTVPYLPAAVGVLRARGVRCLATALYDAKPLDEAGRGSAQGVCIVVGSEGQGLSEDAIAACDMAVKIPMTDKIESLNAGVAGSVLLWHFRGV